MKILLSILVLFSQAFAVIITPSNIDQNFAIDSIEGIGFFAVTEDFKTTLKLKFPDQLVHGENIKKEFCEYAVMHLHLNTEERLSLFSLLTKEISDSSMLIPFDHVLPIIQTQ